MASDYPYLNSFLGGWFHQDYSIEGDVPDIIPKYIRSTDTVEVWATIADIRRFLLYNTSDVDAAFDSQLDAAVMPQGWGMTAAEWLRWVERLMLESVPSLPEETHPANDEGS